MSRQILGKYRQLKNYPLTKNKALRNLIKFLLVKSRFKLNRNKPITFKWIEGLKYRCNKTDAGIFGNVLFDLFDYEDSLFLIHFLNEKDTFLDIGANVGHFTLLASGISKCNSIAIEPIPDTYSKLVENVKLNGLGKKVNTLNIGVSDKNGELYFSTDHDTVNHIVNESYEKKTSVSVKTIDDLIDGNSIQAMKIDIEGFEWFALKGGTHLLESDELLVIITELNGSGDKYGIKDEDVDHLLRQNGFSPFAYSPSDRQLRKIEQFNTDLYNTIYLRNLDKVNNRLRLGKKVRIWKNIF